MPHCQETTEIPNGSMGLEFVSSNEHRENKSLRASFYKPRGYDMKGENDSTKKKDDSLLKSSLRKKRPAEPLSSERKDKASKTSKRVDSQKRSSSSSQTPSKPVINGRSSRLKPTNKFKKGLLDLAKVIPAIVLDSVSYVVKGAPEDYKLPGAFPADTDVTSDAGSSLTEPTEPEKADIKDLSESVSHVNEYVKAFHIATPIVARKAQPKSDDIVGRKSAISDYTTTREASSKSRTNTDVVNVEHTCSSKIPSCPRCTTIATPEKLSGTDQFKYAFALTFKDDRLKEYNEFIDLHKNQSSASIQNYPSDAAPSSASSISSSFISDNDEYSVSFASSRTSLESFWADEEEAQAEPKTLDTGLSDNSIFQGAATVEQSQSTPAAGSSSIDISTTVTAPQPCTNVMFATVVVTNTQQPSDVAAQATQVTAVANIQAVPMSAIPKHIQAPAPAVPQLTPPMPTATRGSKPSGLRPHLWSYKTKINKRLRHMVTKYNRVWRKLNRMHGFWYESETMAMPGMQSEDIMRHHESSLAPEAKDDVEPDLVDEYEEDIPMLSDAEIEDVLRLMMKDTMDGVVTDPIDVLELTNLFKMLSIDDADADADNDIPMVEGKKPWWSSSDAVHRVCAAIGEGPMDLDEEEEDGEIL